MLRHFLRINGVGILIERKTTRISLIVLATGVVNVGLNALLVPGYGGVGACVAAVASWLFGNVLVYLASPAIGRQWLRLRDALSIAVLLGLAIGADYFLPEWTGSSAFFEAGARLAVSVGVGLSGLYAVSGVNPWQLGREAGGFLRRVATSE
jgi:peptidoglycan biosynthesis protein MviN/MurJ (putative lipid II flippase)